MHTQNIYISRSQEEEDKAQMVFYFLIVKSYRTRLRAHMTNYRHPQSSGKQAVSRTAVAAIALALTPVL